MKEKILQLREEGKTYKQIQEILNCSKSTISYYCGVGQKEKVKDRTKKRRENIILKKLETYKYRKNRYKKECVRKFNKRDNSVQGKINKDFETTFTWETVIEKFGEDAKCYLTGIDINLFKDEYHFDHIIPVSRGGNNSLENLGILTPTVNNMKGDLTTDELLMWCIKNLEHNGYSISKKLAR